MQKKFNFLIKFLKKRNIKENTIDLMINKKKFNQFLNYYQFSYIIAKLIQNGYSKKISKELLNLLNNSNIVILEKDNKLLIPEILILENKKLLDPKSNQYFINFYSISDDKKIILDLSKLPIYIKNAYLKQEYSKVIEYGKSLIVNKKVYKISSKEELEIFIYIAESILHNYVGLKSIKKLNYFYKLTNHKIFFLFSGMVLFLKNHYKFSEFYLKEFLKFAEKDPNSLHQEINKAKAILTFLKLQKKEKKHFQKLDILHNEKNEHR